jgi:type III restriction enzyme
VRQESKIETEFLQYLETENTVEWWYKNWVKKETYFWILYTFWWKQSVFYPDFIVKYKNWKIGIFDTKDWNTASSMETRFKAEALQKYIKNNKNLFGWIVIKHKDLFYLNQNNEYSFVNDNLAGWDKI